jgi:hypothetical protein
MKLIRIDRLTEKCPKCREKVMLIIQLIKDYLNGEDMPKRIRYDMMMDGYEYFRWDSENEEYVCETDDKCFLSAVVPWHHLRDFVEIVEERSE